jgi:hypothetical protein
LAARNAVASTHGVVPATTGEGSVLSAALFAARGVRHQTMSAQVAVIQEMFVTSQGTSAGTRVPTGAADAITVV